MKRIAGYVLLHVFVGVATFAYLAKDLKYQNIERLTSRPSIDQLESETAKEEADEHQDRDRLQTNPAAETPNHRLYNQTERQYQLPAGIVRAIAEVESSHNPRAFNKESESFGLMQIKMIPTGKWAAKELGIYTGEDREQLKQKLLVPENNVKIGGFVLRGYLDQNNGNLVAALADYSNDDSGRYSQKVLKVWQN